MHAKQECIES